MEWLTEYKIPVGKWSKAVVDWLTDYGGWFFDGLATGLEAAIDAILWVLQTPPPLIVIAIFVAIAYALRRSASTAALVAVGLLFIVNQGYWEQTTETLTLVLSACLVCMAVGSALPPPTDRGSSPRSARSSTSCRPCRHSSI